jgi:hypothetical protein
MSRRLCACQFSSQRSCRRVHLGTKTGTSGNKYLRWTALTAYVCVKQFSSLLAPELVVSHLYQYLSCAPYPATLYPRVLVRVARASRGPGRQGILLPLVLHGHARVLAGIGLVSVGCVAVRGDDRRCSDLVPHRLVDVQGGE